MQDRAASRTALITSLMRSRHTRRDPHKLLDDPWGERLVPERAFQAMHDAAQAARAVGTLKSDAHTARDLVDDWLLASAVYPNVILRSRFTEDALSAALARGVRQYVLIGAGFDTYSLRRSGADGHVRVFEIDHPATQALKVQGLLRTCGSLPAATRFVPADLATEDVFEALSASGFDAAEPAFFSWLGVTMYLPRDANLRLLRSVATNSVPGSEMVFSYLDEVVFREAEREPAGPFASLLQAVASIGEPFLSGFDPPTLQEILAAEGLDLVQDLNDVQVAARYDAEGVNGFKPSPVGRIARAMVSS